MALKNCTECGTQVSDTAAACPKCGAAPKRRTSVVTWMAAIVAGVWLVGYMATISHQTQPAGPQKAPTYSAPPEPSPKEIAAKQIGFDFDGHRTGFNTILEIAAKIDNKSKYDIRDFTISCIGFGASGTPIDSKEKKFYEVVKKGQKKRFADLSMGFLNSQVKDINCVLADFEMP